VQYGYLNMIQPHWPIYPSGRKIDFQYGASTGDNSKLVRVAALRLAGENEDLVNYLYCGLDRFVKVGYVQPGVELTYIKDGAGTTHKEKDESQI
jgi:hypothetical protein